MKDIRSRNLAFCFPFGQRQAQLFFILKQTFTTNIVTYYTALRIANCPHRPTRVFSVCFVLTRTFFRKTFQKVIHPKIAQSQARLTVEFLWFGQPKIRCILLI
ncbi:hypothetical protein MTR_7g017090 [Medicago truncatula]|uniref:Uncharacterized protein n=1 Tax=Medicago truncatula TaxID=3880 RepID=Q2HSG1_MEDTR|nr:hypothetical protein MtrDRAFT_AC151523g15v2 [Medicago truncatula]AES77776.1 hypothetical protein MTR_7g017090 [Medicago truncatula]